MGVPGERQRHAAGNLRKDVRLMHHEDERLVPGHLGERARQIVDPLEVTVPKPDRDLVADPGQPESLARLSEPERIIFHHRDIHRGERGSNPGNVVPPVVIAEDGEGTEPRFEPRQLARPGRMRHALGHEVMRREIIAEQQDEVRRKRVRNIDHLPHPLEAHIRAARMEVGNNRQRQPLPRRPCGGPGTVVRDPQAERLDLRGVGRGAGPGQPDQPGPAENEPAPADLAQRRGEAARLIPVNRLIQVNEFARMDHPSI